jgi:hypothetical protein
MDIYDRFRELMEILSPLGASLSSSVECEEFFNSEASLFSDVDEFVNHVKVKSHEWFTFIHGAPEWIQESEWQFNNNKPMKFIGYIEIPRDSSLYHDDARIYVFLDPESGVTKNVIQMA